MNKAPILAVLAVVMLSVTGCGGEAARSQPSSVTGDSSAPAPSVPKVFGPPGPERGVFQLSMDSAHPSGEVPFRVVSGSVFDVELGRSTFTEERMAEGCVIAKIRGPACEPRCEGGTGCSYEGLCKPFGARVQVGEVTISGLTTESGDERVSLPSVSGEPYYPEPGVQLAFPACHEGEPLTLSAEGGYYDAFGIDTTCIAPLDVTLPTPLAVNRAEPLELSWVPPASPMPSRILVVLELTQDGPPGERLFCNLPDTGHYTISAELVTGLMDLGVRGYPYLRLRRAIVAYAAVDGGFISFGSQSPWVTYLSGPNLISCMDSSECPIPQTCSQDLLCVDGP